MSDRIFYEIYNVVTKESAVLPIFDRIFTRVGALGFILGFATCMVMLVIAKVIFV